MSNSEEDFFCVPDEDLEITVCRENDLMISAEIESSSEDTASMADEDDAPMPSDENPALGDFAVLISAIDAYISQQAESTRRSHDDLMEAEEPPISLSDDSSTGSSESRGGDIGAEGAEASPSLQIQKPFYNPGDLIFEVISPPLINPLHCNLTVTEYFGFDAIKIACELLHAAASQVKINVIVDEASVRSIAHGLNLAMEYKNSDGTPCLGRRGVGRLVAAIVIDSQSGIVLGHAVAQLVPHSVIEDATGNVMGMILHHVTRGFAYDAHIRRIITEATGPRLLGVNHISEY